MVSGLDLQISRTSKTFRILLPRLVSLHSHITEMSTKLTPGFQQCLMSSYKNGPGSRKQNLFLSFWVTSLLGQWTVPSHQINLIFCGLRWTTWAEVAADMLISQTRLMIWIRSWETWVCIWVCHCLFSSAAYYTKGPGIIQYQNHHRSLFLCRSAGLHVQSRWRSLYTRCTPVSTASNKAVLESWKVAWGCSRNCLFMST